VVITGGEPTLQDDLPDFINKVKQIGYLVKLDTNAHNPEALAKCLDLADVIAIDLKATCDKYVTFGGNCQKLKNRSKC